MRAANARLLTWAERQVRACRPIALKYFRSASLRVERKADRSPVTQADRAIEERLRKALARDFPGERTLGEEFGRSGAGADSFWSIDPIDGTRAFSRGLPSWGIMLGRVERGRAVLGVVDYPAIGTTIAVGPGVRAYERTGSRRIAFPKPRPVRSLKDAVIFHGGLRWWNQPRYIRAFEKVIQASYLERAYGDCFGYLYVLRGQADAMLDYGVKPWDLIPFAALAASTGHLLCDFHARPSFTGPETIMAHPSLAKLLAKTLNSSVAK